MGNDFAEIQRKQYEFANRLLFETPSGLRFTQDSPVLPNVWLAFALAPREPQELILTTSRQTSTGQTALEIRTMLNNLRKKAKGADLIQRRRARVSYIPGQIAVRVYFDELMRTILPLTPWWHETYNHLRKLQRKNDEQEDPKIKTQVADWRPFPQPDHQRRLDLTDALMVMRRELDRSKSLDDGLKEEGTRRKYIRKIPSDLTWIVRVAGLISESFMTGKPLLSEGTCSARLAEEFHLQDKAHGGPYGITNSEKRNRKLNDDPGSLEKAWSLREAIASNFLALYRGWNETDDGYPEGKYIWRVTINRPVKLAVNKSAMTVKADAAARLFDISCKDITWAVIDSGIDPTHPAFRDTSAEYEKERRNTIDQEEPERAGSLSIHDLKKSRIKMVLDFTKLRTLLDLDLESENRNRAARERRQKIIEEISRRTKIGTPAAKRKKADKLLRTLRTRIQAGKDISWEDLKDAIIDQDPPVPLHDHGTHVAGILGADWIDDLTYEETQPLTDRTRRLQGVCPNINLIDVRVFRDDGLTDEFELLAAIQYLRWMNSRAGTMEVHGANLSLSLIHEVRRFACGQTPICEECNESSALGMVIVAAAGNRGFEMGDTERISAAASYRPVSITDPGNAQSVITVGSTHRKRPHEYGVSYFSSRGPTGDGRSKPDLVAPGEKIKSTSCNERAEFKDGTSMAAPHVSGVAALLMARHTELVGQPERIKKILCETATDLGRERYFQGHGLVDALRALQSV